MSAKPGNDLGNFSTPSNMHNSDNNIWTNRLDLIQGPNKSQAWATMELLLDEKMPVSKKDWRRWFLLIILLLLLIGVCNCPAVFRIGSMSKPNEKVIVTEKARPDKNVRPDAKPKVEKEITIAEPFESGLADNEKVKSKNVKFKNSEPELIQFKRQTGVLINESMHVSSELDRQIRTSLPILLNEGSQLVFQRLELKNLQENINVVKDSIQQEESDKSNSLNDLKGWQGAVGLNQAMPVGGQQRSNFNSEGTIGSWQDYLPVPQFRYRFNKRWSAQIEAQFNSPQYTKDVILEERFSSSNPNNPRFARTLTLKKLIYWNVPLLIHYQPIKGLDVGGGIQFAQLKNAVGEIYQRLIIPGGPDSARSFRVQSLKSDPVYEKFATKEWRILLDANYEWKRFMIGTRFNLALKDFVNIQLSSGSLVQSRNHSFQFYLRYSFIERIKKLGINRQQTKTRGSQ